MNQAVKTKAHGPTYRLDAPAARPSRRKNTPVIVTSMVLIQTNNCSHRFVSGRIALRNTTRQSKRNAHAVRIAQSALGMNGKMRDPSQNKPTSAKVESNSSH